MLGRFIIGFDLGIDSAVMPIYLSEVAPIQIRGWIITISILAEILGSVASGGVVLLCKEDWRTMFIIGILPSLFQIFSLYFIPES